MFNQAKELELNKEPRIEIVGFPLSHLFSYIFSATNHIIIKLTIQKQHNIFTKIQTNPPKLEPSKK